MLSPLPRSARPLRRALVGVATGLALLAAPDAAAQYAEGGARSIALGRTGVALGGQAWGHLNPATWAGLGDRVVGVEASQAYGLGELRLAGATAAAPVGFGTAALSARSFGSEGYGETRVVLGLGRDVPLSSTRALSVGVAAGYDGVSIDGFGSAAGLHLAAGVQGEVLPALTVGLAARGLAGLVRSADDDLERPLSSVPVVAAGLAYRPAPNALFLLDAEQDLERDLSIRAGIEVSPVSALALRLGVGSAPVRLSGGIGVVAGPLRVDVAAERHETLGLTPAVAIGASF